jgi:hypothetical protein
MVVPVENDPESYTFYGCPCDRQEFILPDAIAAGLAGGPLFCTRKNDEGR